MIDSKFSKVASKGKWLALVALGNPLTQCAWA